MIAKIQEINGTPTQNFQMVAVEKILVPAINIVIRSGAMTQVPNKEKQPNEAWVRKTPEKVPTFDVGREKKHLWKPNKTLLIQA